MNKEFVTYEQAVALKELGFDEPCFGGYVKLTETQNTFFMNDVISEIDRETPLHKDLITKAPLYQQAFRWFREKYKLHSYIHSDYSWNISGGIWDLNGHIGSRYDWDSDTYPTYEEAEQACLDKLIEIVKKDAHI